jgi:phospholipid/cholesterol/gamma-HCH transport system ATP-binding protein
MKASPAVEFQEVNKSFGERKTLDAVSFLVEKGQTLCILGRSGTGKSVTLKLMIGLLKPDSGEVRIDGEAISKMKGVDLSRVRKSIGFLFQSAALFDSYTVGENLGMPLRYLDKTRSPAEIVQAVAETLRSVGLEKDKDKLPSELSGGMKKRAGLARALILNPTLLLVDEPSSGLDRITASEIDDLLLKVKTERHTTMVIVTHDVHSARRLADKVAVLDKGRLVAFGTVEETEASGNETARKLISET